MGQLLRRVIKVLKKGFKGATVKLLPTRMVGVNLGDGTHAVVQARKILLSEDAGDASRFAQNYVADWPGVAVTSVDERRRARALLQGIRQPFEPAAASPAKNAARLNCPTQQLPSTDQLRKPLAASHDDGIDIWKEDDKPVAEDDRHADFDLGL